MGEKSFAPKNRKETGISFLDKNHNANPETKNPNPILTQKDIMNVVEKSLR